MRELETLPKGWAIAKLSEIFFSLESGKRPKGGVQGIKSGIPSIGAEHLNTNGGFKFEKIKFVPKDFANSMHKGVIKINDIIIVKDGATTAKTSFVGKDFPFEFAVTNEHVFILRMPSEISAKYIFYKLISYEGKKQILEDFRGAAQGGITAGFLDKVIIPLAPLPEQKRILAKLEQLLTDLDKGIEYLETAQKQLKVYRQAVLKWAFEGKLTNKNLKDGELPKGWERTEIGKVCKCIVPNRDKPKSFSGNFFLGNNAKLVRKFNSH